MLFEVSSRRPPQEIENRLKQAAARHKFGILGTHNLRQAMANKGVDFHGECMIYEVCNPHRAKQVLEANASIATALPCRISVYRSGNEYRIATLLPTEVLRLFGNPELDPVAREVEEAIKAIILETA